METIRARFWLIWPVLAAAALALPTAATATHSLTQGQPTTQAQTPSAVLTGCHVAVDQANRYATFTGQMSALPDSQTMELQVQLQEQSASGSGYTAVTDSGLGTWRRSAAGVGTYRYVSQVTNLPAPASFRAIIYFRWLGSHGQLIRQLSKRTGVCVQPDERPLLVVASVSVTPTQQSSQAQYAITVRNQGRGPAGPFGVLFSVAGAQQPELAVPSLAPAAYTVLDAVAPRCAAGSVIRVALDPQRQLSEASGGGQSATVPCPLPAAAAPAPGSGATGAAGASGATGVSGASG